MAVSQSLIISKVIAILVIFLAGIISLLTIQCKFINKRKRVLSILSTFGGGIFLATCLMHILPEAVELQEHGLETLHTNGTRNETINQHGEHAELAQPLMQLLCMCGQILVLALERVIFAVHGAVGGHGHEQQIDPSSKKCPSSLENTKSKKCCTSEENTKSDTKSKKCCSSEENSKSDNLNNSGEEGAPILNKKINNISPHEVPSLFYSRSDIVDKNNEIPSLFYSNSAIEATNNYYFPKKSHNNSDKWSVKSTNKSNQQSLDIDQQTEVKISGRRFSVTQIMSEQLKRVGRFSREIWSNQSVAKSAIMLAMILAFHSIFDGMIIGLQTDAVTTYIITGAIGTHKSFEAIIVGTAFTKTNADKTTSTVWAMIFTFSGILGIITGIILSYANLIAVGCLNAISAGTFLQISLTEIVPEDFDNIDRVLKFIAFVAGCSIMPVMTIWKSVWHSGH